MLASAQQEAGYWSEMLWCKILGSGQKGNVTVGLVQAQEPGTGTVTQILWQALPANTTLSSWVLRDSMQEPAEQQLLDSST